MNCGLSITAILEKIMVGTCRIFDALTAKIDRGGCKPTTSFFLESILQSLLPRYIPTVHYSQNVTLGEVL